MYLVQEMESAFNNKLYLTSLNTALIIPDVCSALSSVDGLTDGKKYKAWVNEYCELIPRYIKAEELYKIRCASLHQGKLKHKKADFERVIFQIPEPAANIFHFCIIKNAMIVNLKLFIEEIKTGYQTWFEINSETENYQKNIQESILYYPLGIDPYIVGVPLIT